ncbi:MAG: hypothetical protein QOI53_714 [Verrucomicrobiota bacterium]|jgi:precorrin-6B methylase 1|nr:hypothetical protein [Verrucomicrobiota bacterium]
MGQDIGNTVVIVSHGQSFFYGVLRTETTPLDVHQEQPATSSSAISHTRL